MRAYYEKKDRDEIAMREMELVLNKHPLDMEEQEF